MNLLSQIAHARELRIEDLADTFRTGAIELYVSENAGGCCYPVMSLQEALDRFVGMYIFEHHLKRSDPETAGELELVCEASDSVEFEPGDLEDADARVRAAQSLTAIEPAPKSLDDVWAMAGRVA